MKSDNSNYFSISQLLGMRLPSYPDTRQGWDTLVKREKWEYREVKGLGGPGGVRREYAPPPAIMALIEACHRGDIPPAARPRLTKPGIESINNEVFGGSPARFPKNEQFELMLKRVAEASQATVRVSKQFDFALPVEWTSLIQELMAMHGLTEAGAKRVIEALKQQT